MDGDGPGSGARPRSRFITWFLVGTGAVVAFLSLCQRQKTLEDLSEWDFHLRAAGKVLVLSGRSALLETAARDVELVAAEREPELVRLAAGTDEDAFADGLSGAGYGGVVVDVVHDERGRLAPLSVQTRLARFHPGRRFHALMLRPEAGLYRPREPFEVADDVLAFLLQAARRSLGGARGEDLDAGAPPAATAPSDRGFDVAIQLQGLRLREVRSQRANRIRQDLYATGTGPTLLEAVVDAAGEIAELFERDHAAAEGPLAEAMARYWVELHVLHGFSLVSHLRGDVDKKVWSTFLEHVVDPGLYGFAVNWAPPRDGRALGRTGFKLRLPADAVYWSRQGHVRVLERILTDARIGKIDSLADREHLSLDRFSSIHVVEREPGAGMVRLHRGLVAEAAGPEPHEILAHVAGWIARDISPEGRLRESYYPVRDLNWIGGDERRRTDAVQQGLGVAGLYMSADALGDARVRAAADRALGYALGWVRACPGLGIVPSAPLADALPAIGQEQVLEWCGPVGSKGEPVAVSQWGPDETPAGEVPDDLAFIVQGSTARLGATALVLAGLSDHLSAGDGRQGSESLDALLAGLVNFVLFMQRKDGTFQSHFVVRDHARFSLDEPADGGMALLALSRARHLVDDDRIADALERGLAAHGSLVEATVSSMNPSSTICARLAGTVPWMALAGAAAGRPDASGPALLIDRCLAGPEAVHDPFLAGSYSGTGDTIPGWQDVLAAAAAAACLDGVDRGSPLAGRLAEAVGLGTALASRLVVTPGPADHFIPVPEKAAGGVGRDLVDHRQRLDHAFAVVALLAGAAR